MIGDVTANDEPQTPIEQALDLFVYLPVGFVFELPRSIPRFIERGRRELHGNGRLTDSAVRLDPLQRLDRAQAQAVSTLRALGVMPRSEPAAAPGPPETAGEAAGTSATDIDTAAVPPAEAIDPETLAIPGYESLSASQVMPRLESLTPDELEAVRRYEHDNRARKTILNKIAQLQRAG
jgi:hypothetical protein